MCGMIVKKVRRRLKHGKEMNRAFTRLFGIVHRHQRKKKPDEREYTAKFSFARGGPASFAIYIHYAYADREKERECKNQQEFPKKLD